MASRMSARDLVRRPFVFALGLSACHTPDPDGAASTSDDASTSSTGAETSSEPSSSGASEDTSGSPTLAPLGGGVEKGPLIIGSTVTASRLDASGMPTGEVYSGQIENDAGEFDLGDVPVGLYRLQADGFHFDEVRGALGTAPITLRAVVEVVGDPIYVNVLTDLTQARVVQLLGEALEFSDARAQAEQELVAGLPIGVPGFVLEDDAEDASMLAGDSPGARYLLAVSAVLANDAVIVADGGATVDAQLQLRMNTLGADLRDDGVFEAAALDSLLSPLLQLDPAQVESNMSARLVTLGLPGAVPDLDLVLDQDRDALVNADDNCPTDPNPGQADADDDHVGDVCDVYAVGEPENLAEIASIPGDFDVADGVLYFTTTDGEANEYGLWSVDAAGGTPDSLREDLLFPARVQAAGGYLYFYAAAAQRPHRTDLLGQNLLDLGLYPGTRFETDDTFFYSAYSALARRPHEGVDEIITELPTVLSAMALGTDVVAILHSEGVDVVDKDGTDYRTLADHTILWASGIVTDDDAVYWLEVDVCELWRAPLDGGDPSVIWTAELELLPNGGMFCSAGFIGPALDGEYVYWAGIDVITRVPRAGGAAELVAIGEAVAWPTSVRFDATHVYWANRYCDDEGANCESGSIMRVQTPS